MRERNKKNIVKKNTYSQISDLKKKKNKTIRITKQNKQKKKIYTYI